MLATQDQVQANRLLRPISPTFSNTSSRTPRLLKILLVDDNHINLSVLSTLLKRRFHHVLSRPPVCLESGLKVIQLLRAEVFDLIFMDIEMPYMDGVECTKKIRSGQDGILTANQNIQIVAVTTKVGQGPEVLYRQAQMDGMIAKPFRFDHFQQYLCPLAREALGATVDNGKTSRCSVQQVGSQCKPFFTPSCAQTNADTIKPADNSSSRNDRDSCLLIQEEGLADSHDFLLKPDQGLLQKHGFGRSPTICEYRRSSIHHFLDDAMVPVAKPRYKIEARTGADSKIQTVCASDQTEYVTTRPLHIHRLSSPPYLLDASPIMKLRNEPISCSLPLLGQITTDMYSGIASVECKERATQEGQAGPAFGRLSSSRWSIHDHSTSIKSGETSNPMSPRTFEACASSDIATPQSSLLELDLMNDDLKHDVFGAGREEFFFRDYFQEAPHKDVFLESYVGANQLVSALEKIQVGNSLGLQGVLGSVRDHSMAPENPLLQETIAFKCRCAKH